jgi:hypothetical protein
MSKEHYGTRSVSVFRKYVKEIRELILCDAHDFTYSIHPRSTNMYHDLKSRYWWHGMKRAIAEYIALCDNYQRVKAECQRPT